MHIDDNQDFQTRKSGTALIALKSKSDFTRAGKTTVATVADDLMQFTSPLSSTVKINNLELPKQCDGAVPVSTKQKTEMLL
jgi:hypothetical protein